MVRTNKNVTPQIWIGALAAAVVGIGLLAVFAPVTRLTWVHTVAIVLGFGLAGVCVGWLGWRQANSQTAVALISLIVSLTSFLLVVNVLPDIAGYLIWDDDRLGYGAAVFLWLLLVVVLGLVGTAVASPNGQSIWRKLNWRLLILALMLITFFGPWGYDLLNIPGEFDCEWPTFRVAEEFCGYPFPGFIAIGSAPFVGLSVVAEIVQGEALPSLLNRFGVLFALLVPLPLLAAIFRRRTVQPPQPWVISMKIWGLAFIGGTGFLIWYASLRPGPLPFQVWGIWAYVLLAILALLSEAVLLVLANASRKKHGD